MSVFARKGDSVEVKTIIYIAGLKDLMAEVQRIYPIEKITSKQVVQLATGLVLRAEERVRSIDLTNRA